MFIHLRGIGVINQGIGVINRGVGQPSMPEREFTAGISEV